VKKLSLRGIKGKISLTQKVSSSPEGIYVSSQHGGSEDRCESSSHVITKVPIEEKTQKVRKGCVHEKERAAGNEKESELTCIIK